MREKSSAPRPSSRGSGTRSSTNPSAGFASAHSAGASRRSLRMAMSASLSQVRENWSDAGTAQASRPAPETRTTSASSSRWGGASCWSISVEVAEGIRAGAVRGDARRAEREGDARDPRREGSTSGHGARRSAFEAEPARHAVASHRGGFATQHQVLTSPREQSSASRRLCLNLALGAQLGPFRGWVRNLRDWTRATRETEGRDVAPFAPLRPDSASRRPFWNARVSSLREPRRVGSQKRVTQIIARDDAPLDSSSSPPEPEPHTPQHLPAMSPVGRNDVMTR